MGRYILEALVQVGPIILIAVFILKDRTKENYLRLFLFAAIYVAYQLILILPRFISKLNLIKSNWNWEGKGLGIMFGVVCYFAFRRFFANNNFFTLKQNADNRRVTKMVSIGVLLTMTILYYFIGQSEFDKETLAFQLTMPALDEEIIFRGILLGLLLTALPNKGSFIGNPAILLSAILFGFLHALALDKNYELHFDLVYFLHTGIGGYVFGWLALKSRSLVLPGLTHGLTNFFAAFATMIK